MAFTPRNVISDVSIPAPDFGLMAKSAQAVQSRDLEGFNKAQSYYKSLLKHMVKQNILPLPLIA
jgi:hypothetical protein